MRIALCTALPLLAALGCNDFLKGGELTNNPTSPTTANIGQLFVSTETALWAQQTEALARLTSMWTQQLHGVARQQLGIYNYVGINEGTFDGEFNLPYIGGGLIDLRRVDSMATAAGDRQYLGVAQIIEAMQLGTAADMWGDIPFTQAAKPDSFPTPALDPQMTVYDSLQSLLDEAIVNLGGDGPGPQGADLVYGGDPAQWIALAHTLKARLYLHTAEVNGTSAYATALAEAQQGIASNAGDYVVPFTGANEGESNPFWQIMNANGGTGRDGDLIADGTTYLYRLLDDAGDPRRDEYYDLANKDGGYLSAFRGGPAYPQPIVTYNENLLILAEAQFQTGDEAGALSSLNAEREAWGTQTQWHSAISLAPSAASGGALLQAIMTEKYITLFQNPEAWNDYKRTCIPALTPANGATVIPGRLLYGVTERQTNPSVPEPSQQPARNANDPSACPAP
ncbi:MAG TPA: SusD/RagB family nutrient-binding outer membrane lipoprotein [Gemmatimonadaceae bacterium]|nr:SusD/RagB family nutrient-binding outer membrane lipoprotein [Gemmatimonadaceae bacterium]